MKKLYRIIVVSLTLLLMLSITVFADNIELPGNVELIGDASGIVFFPEDEPFLIAENMMPGDSVIRSMFLRNNYEYPYKIYVRAERVTPEEEYDLLEKIDISISYQDEVIYQGVATGEDGMTKNIYLGTIKPGESKELAGKAVLDGSATDNNYKNKRAEVKWIFTAIRQNDYVEEEEPDYDKPEDPPIKDDIEEEENLPQTGESIVFIISKVFLAFLLIIMGAYLLIGKKKFFIKYRV